MPWRRGMLLQNNLTHFCCVNLLPRKASACVVWPFLQLRDLRALVFTSPASFAAAGVIPLSVASAVAGRVYAPFMAASWIFIAFFRSHGVISSITRYTCATVIKAGRDIAPFCDAYTVSVSARAESSCASLTTWLHVLANNRASQARSVQFVLRWLLTHLGVKSRLV